MQEPKVARENAEAEVDLMLEALGVDAPEPASREVLVRVAMAGRIVFDPAKQEGTYRLGVPVLLENGQTVAEVKFHEPNGAELLYIVAGQRMDVDATKKTASMDLAQEKRTTIRYLTKVSGLDLGVAERVKARDLTVVQAIAGFFQ